MPVRIPKLEFDASLRMDTSILEESSSPSGENPRILLIRMPLRRPGWGIVLKSSHRKVDTLKHLIYRMMWEELRKREWILLQELSLSLGEFLFKIILNYSKFKNNQRRGEIAIQLATALSIEFPHFFKNSARIAHSFEPEITVTKFWVKKRNLPPKSFIGKGHNDSGSRGSALAWQEQMILDEGEESESDLERLNTLLRRFRRVYKY